MPWTSRTAIKEAKKLGGKLLRHGAEHDLYIMPDGTKVTIPRHPGDLTPGVERDIKKKLGFK